MRLPRGDIELILRNSSRASTTIGNSWVNSSPFSRETFPQHLRALREAITRRDRRQAAIVSYTLKGMLANLAVSEAAATAARLEQLAVNGTEESQKQALSAFEKEIDGLLPELESYMAEAQR